MADDSSINRIDTMNLNNLYRVPVIIEGVHLSCYIDEDDNCEAVLCDHASDLGSLLELVSCAGDRWWRVLDDHIDTALSELKAQAEADKADERTFDRELDKLCY
jgi:hypothetical protein